MAADVNVIAYAGVHKTTRKDTLKPSEPRWPFSFHENREFGLARAKKYT